jgi:cytochrome c biogenesis protein CcdA/thiol-disulfide isomerase/thioredoxin
MLLLLGSFIAGVLTVLAPCVLPLLPIIIGGSISSDKVSKKRPLIVAISLAISLLAFTLLLKATSVLINVPPDYFKYISGAIIILLGFFTLFPMAYARILAKLGLESRAMRLLSKSNKTKNENLSAIITGAALGPVFSSCSPVYAYILASVLPVDFGVAMAYMIAYILGLSTILLMIGYFGQKFTRKIAWMSDPKGAFQKVMAILFIVTGLLIITGYDKRFQTYVSANTPFDIDSISERLIPESKRAGSDNELFNVEAYKAPEKFVGLDNWINSKPIKLEEQRGKVVLVDFWTYSCINCIRNNPHINEWHEKYKDDGLVVVGVHAPEFAFEKNSKNVEKAVKDQKISYPVALDNDFETWGEFENQFWPAYYLIDAKGMIRRVHTGEGEYEQSEQAIRKLLEENGAKLDDELTTSTQNSGGPTIRDDQTPETYLGTRRASNFASPEALGSKPAQFSFPDMLKSNKWALSGGWMVDNENIVASKDAKLRFSVNAKEVYVVAESDQDNHITVLLDGKPITETGFEGVDVDQDSNASVKEAQLYRLAKFSKFEKDKILELEVPEGVSLNVFTFAS